MKTGRIAGFVLGLVLPALPASATEPQSVRDAMARAQSEAQRKGTANLIERIEKPGKRSLRPAEDSPAAPLPDFKTRSMPDVQNTAPGPRK